MVDFSDLQGCIFNKKNHMKMDIAIVILMAFHCSLPITEQIVSSATNKITDLG